MFNWIPGHARAYTIWVALLLGTVVFISTSNMAKTTGIVLLVFGLFVADQATHLAQHHDEAPPTMLERTWQLSKWEWVITGTFTAVVGVLLLIK